MRHPITATILYLAATAALSAQLVERVVDGDTLVVRGVGTVRLIGVDTPESVAVGRPVEAFGKEASEFTRRAALGKTARLEFEGRPRDRYGRRLAYVYLPDGILLNAEIVRGGYGHAYTEFPFTRLAQFRALEREAREARRGLWGAAAARARGGDCVDINRASAADLQRIVHVDRERAAQIVTLRGRRRFGAVRDLIRVNGIGQGRLRDIETEGLACVRP